MPSSIGRARGALTEGCIRGWFTDARQFFTQRGIEYVLESPCCQYNGDKSGFQLDPKSGCILAPKGENVYTEAGGNKEQVTVLITTRADGKMMTPAVIFPYKRFVPQHIVDKIPEGFAFLAVTLDG